LFYATTSASSDFFNTMKELIHLIYETALHPETWTPLLTLLSETFDSDGQALAKKGDSLDTSDISTHLQRAMTISGQISDSDDYIETLETGLEHIPAAVFLFQEESGIKAMNHRAKALPHPIKKVIHNDLKQTALPHTLHNTRHDSTHVSILDLHYETLAIKGLAIPLRRSETSQKAKLILINNLDQQHLIQPKQLQTLYNTTPKEAQLAVDLIAGLSLNDISKRSERSLHTLRNQLKSLLKKTHTHSQTDLVRKILSEALGLVDYKQHHDIELDNDYQLLKLNDARQLAWSEYGDPEGHPVILCHSIMTARINPFTEPQILEKHRIRLIIPDRPSYGRSDPDPTRTLNSWPADLEQLLDHLQITRCSIIGFEVSALYALAAAHTLPKRIDTVMLANANAPMQGKVLNDFPSLMRFSCRLARYAPALMEQIIRLTARGILSGNRETLKELFPVNTAQDQSMLEDEGIQTMFLSAFKEANRQGWGKAIVQELVILQKPLDFKNPIQAKVLCWQSSNLINTFDFMQNRLPELCDKLDFQNIESEDRYLWYHLRHEIFRAINQHR